MDEAATKEELRPVKKQLADLKLPGEDMPREKKVEIQGFAFRDRSKDKS